MDNNNALVSQLTERLSDVYFQKNPLGLDDFLQGEMKVLTFICHEKRDLLPGQISSSLDMTAGRIAGILKSLESKGMICRRHDDTDRRRVIVSITEAGSMQVVKETERLQKKLGRLTEIMGSEKTIQLIESLDDFIKASYMLDK